MTEYLSPRGQVRQVLANAVAGDLRGDRVEIAANLRRRVGLHVERFVMTGSAGQEHDHNLLGPIAELVAATLAALANWFRPETACDIPKPNRPE